MLVFSFLFIIAYPISRARHLEITAELAKRKGRKSLVTSPIIIPQSPLPPLRDATPFESIDDDSPSSDDSTQPNS